MSLIPDDSVVLFIFWTLLIAGAFWLVCKASNRTQRTEEKVKEQDHVVGVAKLNVEVNREELRRKIRKIAESDDALDNLLAAIYGPDWRRRIGEQERKRVQNDLKGEL